ncbi:hypothetical protein NQU47_07700 [Pseudoalteromonas distincta]|uniref:hypothetical protein n=1 Tax=Pseudoalteromonas distincta TaxID=77608 RepID=UPI0023424DA0|nr:hypothetical protein [Pseudoalteromonas distincta]MDC3212454.1 hypothetical protein [Pseudoalteromonas distincta]
MYKALGKLKTQYWFWFVREHLIELELKKRLDSKRLEKLNRLKENPTLNNIYTMTDLGDELRKLLPYSNLDSNFADSGSKYKNGSRVLPKDQMELVELAVPGSQLAYQNGPKGLFSVLEAKSLSFAISIVAKELFEVLKSLNEESISDDLSFKFLLLRLKQSMFDDTVELIAVIDEIIEYLFPMNKWNEPFSVIINGIVNVGDLEPENLLQPKLFELKAIAPLVIGYAFCKAKYFGEIHYLSKVCYKERYLVFINKVFLIKEKFWVFKPPSSKKVINDPSVLKEGETGMKYLFYRAHSIAKEHTF